MANETNPLDVIKLSVIAIEAMESSQASPGEKAAALRVAANAIQEAAQAQQLAIAMANIIQQNLPKGRP